MATFQVKVEDLIGSVNDTQLISDSLTSSAAELLSALPKECLWVVSTNTGDITAVNYNVEKCLVLNVLRENGTDGDYHNCHEVPSSYFGHVQDVNSVWYPSTSEPVYLLKNGHVYVYPAPGVSPNAFQVEYVTNPAVAFGSSAITGFPDEYESVVVTGAAMKCTIRLMSDSVVSITAVPPDVPGLPNISYSSAVVGDAVSAAVDSITAGPTDAAGVSATAATTDASGTSSTGSTASSYTAPGVEGSAVSKGLLSMTDGTINTDGDQIDYDKFWDVLAEYIESEEDVELASAQLSKIRTYIDAFQAEVQNASAAMQATIEDARQATQASVANAGNDTSIYGASISSQTQASIANAGNDVNASIAKMGQSTSAAIQKMSLSTNVNIQNATKVMDSLVQDYNLTINRYSQELGQYQAEVSKEIEESNSKFSQYSKIYDNLTKEYERGLTVITSRFKQYSPQQASS
jgi:F0F1-type ATP synthase membrane subunit b/b'